MKNWTEYFFQFKEENENDGARQFECQLNCNNVVLNSGKEAIQHLKLVHNLGGF